MREGVFVREHLSKLYGCCGFNVNARRQVAAASYKGRCEQSVANVEVSWAGQRNLS